MALLQGWLLEADLPDAVGMLTSRSLQYVHTAAVTVEGITAEAVATVGLSNALRVGDPPGAMSPGTINLLVRLSAALSLAGSLEALSIAAEARTAAVSAAGWPSRRTDGVATGTGTDCIALATPLRDTALPWCGKHTAAGSAIGQAVLAVIGEGVRCWISQR